jgi:hypothetical protein
MCSRRRKSPTTAATRPKPSLVSQILFGTDHPAEPIPTTTDPLAQFCLLAKDLQAIDRGSAERLFPRLKREEHSEVLFDLQRYV